MVDVVILAAGIGNRTKLNYPKQFVRLGGVPILIHIIQTVKKLSNINKIYLTIIPDKIQEFTNLLNQYNYGDIIIVEGGNTRQESVYNAIQYCNGERILICESCRPFITSDFINKLFNYQNYQVVTSAKRINTTTYNNIDCNFPDRNNLWDIQLPQLIDTKLLKTAHEQAKQNNNIFYTDDTSLILGETNIAPFIVEGLEMNFKITTPIDIKIAEVLYNEFNSNNWS